MALEILLLEMRWDIVWANRVLLSIGPDLTLAMTSDLIPAENWRFWPFVVFSMILIGAFYGTSEIKWTRFIPGFAVFSIAIIAFATNPEYANYDTEKVRIRLVIISILTLFCFILSRRYSIVSEEYQVCLLYTSPSPRDGLLSRMPSSA